MARGKLPGPVLLSASKERALERDLRLLAKFVSLYCHTQHRPAEKAPVRLKHTDLEALRRTNKPLQLCPECTRLLSHAFVKRRLCPLDPKPACKHCPTHCYAAHYRRQIREVMKVSGRKLVLRGRIDYLFHLLAGR